MDADTSLQHLQSGSLVVVHKNTNLASYYLFLSKLQKLKYVNILNVRDVIFSQFSSLKYHGFFVSFAFTFSAFIVNQHYGESFKQLFLKNSKGKSFFKMPEIASFYFPGNWTILTNLCHLQNFKQYSSLSIVNCTVHA